MASMQTTPTNTTDTTDTTDTTNINYIDIDDSIYIPTLSIFSRLAFVNRVCDNSPDFRTLSFNDLYECWDEYNFFKQLYFLGLLTISYNNSPYIIYKPSTKDDNRHQVLALSCYIASSYYNNNNNNNNNHTRGTYITAPREHDNKKEFKALFKTNIKDVEIQYTTKNNNITIFKFNKTKASQFSLSVPLSKTDYV